MDYSRLAMCGTFSKYPTRWGFDPELYATKGTDSSVLLSDGKWYTDWVCGLGANLLGYSQLEFEDSIIQHLHNGISFSLPTKLEYEVAELLVDLLQRRVPGWGNKNCSVRFCKTGTEATSVAVRLARAYTGKDHILHCGYHGWASEFIADTPPALGIPRHHSDDISSFKFNDSIFFPERDDIAAVILEQGIVDPADGWYNFLRGYCDKHNALLVMDETVTGLRYALGGASELYGIQPDVVTMGKALGNGIAVSAVIADDDIMKLFRGDDPVFCSSTHWGETLGLAAAKYVLSMWQEHHVAQLWDIGQKLIDGLRYYGWDVIGHPPRSLLVFNDEYERAFFIHEMRSHGVLMNRPNFISLVHTLEDVEHTISAAGEVAAKEIRVDPREIITEDMLPRLLFQNR